MPKKRGLKRDFNKKSYNKVDVASTMIEADKKAIKLRKNNRVIIDKGKWNGKKAYFIYKRKGKHDK
ncbi:hypothetical protein LCGC14_2221390 [marine sediment metagenome]|uniref:Uncharacterized protein n=1 Tax=marine sediment metagenome TaxID=412755 RepID=A0A0F9DB08_9ZZZZ